MRRTKPEHYQDPNIDVRVGGLDVVGTAVGLLLEILREEPPELVGLGVVSGAICQVVFGLSRSSGTSLQLFGMSRPKNGSVSNSAPERLPSR
jgi:hypothetical protein